MCSDSKSKRLADVEHDGMFFLPPFGSVSPSLGALNSSATGLRSRSGGGGARGDEARKTDGPAVPREEKRPPKQPQRALPQLRRRRLRAFFSFFLIYSYKNTWIFAVVTSKLKETLDFSISTSKI